MQTQLTELQKQKLKLLSVKAALLRKQLHWLNEDLATVFGADSRFSLLAGDVVNAATELQSELLTAWRAAETPEPMSEQTAREFARAQARRYGMSPKVRVVSESEVGK